MAFYRNLGEDQRKTGCSFIPSAGKLHSRDVRAVQVREAAMTALARMDPRVLTPHAATVPPLPH